MTLREWIDLNFRRPDEAITRAIERLAVEWGITYRTLFYVVRGARTTVPVAQAVEERTGGLVQAVGLLTAPTRKELDAREPHRTRPRKRSIAVPVVATEPATVPDPGAGLRAAAAALGVDPAAEAGDVVRAIELGPEAA